MKLEVVRKDGSIATMEWEKDGHSYLLWSSENGIDKSVWSTIDIVKRSDGRQRRFTRRKLMEYFNE